MHPARPPRAPHTPVHAPAQDRVRARAVPLRRSAAPLPWLLLLLALAAALLAAVPAHAAPDPGDPPPLTPVRDPAPTDPEPPRLLVLG